jgi:hypothetical protein
MIQVYLTFLTAIALSAVAGFYSIIGLAQIFPGSFWPIVLMGSILEIAKLVTVSWLYNNWKTAGALLKIYFSIAVIVLMMITSMGIFGYLSKAHLESNIVLGANTVQLRTLEAQEKIAKDRLDYLLKRAGDDPSTISRSTDIAIQTTQTELKKLAEQKLPLLTEENKLSAEIGPIKYIAELFYDKSDPSFIDKAVRAVIITIIIVFDPLAVLLLIAAQKSYRVSSKITNRAKKKPKKNQADHIIELDEGEELVIQYDNEVNEVIPKSKITKLDGGSF